VNLGFGEASEGLGEQLYAAGAGGVHELYAFGGGFEADAAGVFGGVTAHQARALEAGDDAAHSRWPDLLGIGELAEGLRPASKDQHGESRKLGGTNAAGEVADAQPPQKMDGRGVELIGDGESAGGESRSGAGIFVLDRGHRI
jgi:hypothetical protein